METLSLEVRTLEPTEVDDAMHVLALAYGASATQGSRAGMQATPQAWLIARRNGDAAGVVTSNIYGRAAYVAMLAVSPTHRRNGVATKLMQTLLGRLEARGVSSVLLDATAEAEALYRSLGFVEIDRTRVYARAAPLPAGDSRPDVASGALARALRLDALVSGCDRSNALRGFALAPYALVLAEDDGYALARGPVLGPFGAADPATAQRQFAGGFFHFKQQQGCPQKNHQQQQQRRQQHRVQRWLRVLPGLAERLGPGSRHPRSRRPGLDADGAAEAPHNQRAQRARSSNETVRSLI